MLLYALYYHLYINLHHILLHLMFRLPQHFYFMYLHVLVRYLINVAGGHNVVRLCSLIVVSLSPCFSIF